MNGLFTYPATGVTDNQLRTWGHLGLFNPPINEADITNFPKLVAVTNATAGIAPFGGKESLVGNNPPSWALPTKVVDPSKILSAAEYDPVFLDMALSVVAANRYRISGKTAQGECESGTCALHFPAKSVTRNA